MAKRFFAFGCSYTSYTWPTWADLISASLKEQGYECYNFGKNGIGNFAIASSIARADSIFSFDEDDIICVVWTSWYREDRFISTNNNLAPNWANVGSVFRNSVYDDEFIAKYWSLENDIIKNCTAISLCQKAYNLNFEGFMSHDGSGEVRKHSFSDYTSDFLNFNFKNAFDKNYAGVLSPLDQFINLIEGGHPLPAGHLEYVKEVIQPLLPNMNLISENSLTLVRHFTKIIREETRKEFNDRELLDYKNASSFNGRFHSMIVPMIFKELTNSVPTNQQFSKVLWGNRNSAYDFFQSTKTNFT